MEQSTKYFTPQTWIFQFLTNLLEQFGHLSGISVPLTYIGAMGSRFGWHVEDMNLFSISVMLFGVPKIWYSIPPNQGQELENLQERHKKWPCTQCSHPLRHKNNLFCPHFLRSCGINVYKVIFFHLAKLRIVDIGWYTQIFQAFLIFFIYVSLPFKKRFKALNCEKCAKMFQTISSLNYHTKTFHSDKKFKCSTCKPVKRFKYLKNLEAHVN